MTSGKERVCAVFAETEKYVPGSCYKHSDVQYVLVQVQIWVLLKATQTRRRQTVKH